MKYKMNKQKLMNGFQEHEFEGFYETLNKNIRGISRRGHITA